MVRGVLEGKALVSLLADVIEGADQATIDFLIMVNRQGTLIRKDQV